MGDDGAKNLCGKNFEIGGFWELHRGSHFDPCDSMEHRS